MKLITVRVSGHGVTGPGLVVSNGTFIIGTSRKQFEFEVPTPATGEEIGPWSFLYITDSAVIPDGRYGVISVTPDTGFIVVRCVSDTAIPGVATTFSGVAYLDECYTFSDRIPADVSADTRARWSASVVNPSASFGGKYSVLGGAQSTPGASFTLLRSTLAKALLAHAPRPMVSVTGDAVAIDASGGIGAADVSVALTAAPIAGQGREAFIDRECVSLTGTIDDTPDIRRGALNTQARGHSALSPLYRGAPSGVGRDVEIWVYDSPAHCLDTQYRFSGIAEAPEFSQAANEFTFTVRGETFRPRSVVPSSDVLALVKRPVMLFYDAAIDGVYNYIEVAQADPESTWSWCRFGPILVRIKKTEVVTPTDLGYTYVRYLLPYGLHPRAFTTADPKISRRDAINLTGGSDPRAWDLWLERYARPEVVSDLFIEQLEPERRAIIEEGKSYFSANGVVTGNLYYSAPPELCHLFEQPGEHADALALDIWDSANMSDVRAVNTSGFYMPRVSAFGICEQVIQSVNGSGGGNNLLPAELSVGSTRTLTRVQAIGEPFCASVLFSPSQAGDLAKLLSDAVLKPTFTSLALDTSGNWRLIFPVGYVGAKGAKSEAALDLDTLLDRDGVFSLSMDPSTAVREIGVEIISLADAFVTEPEGRSRRGRDATIGGFLAAGDIYAGAVSNSLKFSYILDEGEAAGGYVWNRHILSMFSRPAYILTGDVHRSYAGQVGDYVPVTIKEIPDIYGETNFTGYGFVIERAIDLETDRSVTTWILFPDPAQGSKTWAPALDVVTVASTTEFTFDASQYAKDDGYAFPMFRPGDVVALLSEYGERLDDSGAVVDTYTIDASQDGTMELVSAFTLSGSPVTIQPGNIIVHDERALQSDLVETRFAWFDAAETNPSRWL